MHAITFILFTAFKREASPSDETSDVGEEEPVQATNPNKKHKWIIESDDSDQN